MNTAQYPAAVDVVETRHVARSADGTPIHYRMRGQGRPLLLLHGLQRTSDVWDAVAPALGRDRRLILPDLRGRGRSGQPTAPEAYALDRLVDDLQAVLTDTGVHALDIVAWSMGATVALALLQRPVGHRVQRLALVSALLCARDAGRLLSGPSLAEAAQQAAARASTKGMAQGAAPHAVAAIWSQLRGREPLVQPPPRPLPLLLLHGDADAECDIAGARALARQVHGARLCTLAGVGHNPMHERPGDACRMLLEFLEAA